MSKKKLGISEQWLLDKGYVQDPDGSWSPAPKKVFLPEQKISILPLTTALSPLPTPHEFGYSRQPKAVFNINPIGKPRMTQRDKWSKRKVVQNYWAYKDELLRQAALQNFKMPESDYHIIAVIQMPNSWPDKKKNQMSGSPHKQKIDVDNFLKGIFDALCEEDKYIWDVRVTKLWGLYGRILIY